MLCDVISLSALLPARLCVLRAVAVLGIWHLASGIWHLASRRGPARERERGQRKRGQRETETGHWIWKLEDGCGYADPRKGRMHRPMPMPMPMPPPPEPYQCKRCQLGAARTHRHRHKRRDFFALLLQSPTLYTLLGRPRHP
jgi:hypothetical protein